MTGPERSPSLAGNTRRHAHAIAKLVVDVTHADLSSAHDTPRRLDHTWQGRLHELLDDVLTQWNPTDAIVTLDHLEVDVGHLTRSDWQQELLEQLAAGLLKALGASRSAPPETRAYVREPSPAEPPRNDALAQLIARLRYGVDPWWVNDQGSLSTEDLMKEVLEQHPRELYDWLASDAARASATERMIMQLTPATLRRLERATDGSAEPLRVRFEDGDPPSTSPALHAAHIQDTFAAYSLAHDPPRAGLVGWLFCVLPAPFAQRVLVAAQPTSKHSRDAPWTLALFDAIVRETLATPSLQRAVRSALQARDAPAWWLRSFCAAVDRSSREARADVRATDARGFEVRVRPPTGDAIVTALRQALPSRRPVVEAARIAADRWTTDDSTWLQVLFFHLLGGLGIGNAHDDHERLRGLAHSTGDDAVARAYARARLRWARPAYPVAHEETTNLVCSNQQLEERLRAVCTPQLTAAWQRRRLAAARAQRGLLGRRSAVHAALLAALQWRLESDARDLNSLPSWTEWNALLVRRGLAPCPREAERGELEAARQRKRALAQENAATQGRASDGMARTRVRGMGASELDHQAPGNDNVSLPSSTVSPLGVLAAQRVYLLGWLRRALPERQDMLTHARQSIEAQAGASIESWLEALFLALIPTLTREDDATRRLQVALRDARHLPFVRSAWTTAFRRTLVVKERARANEVLQALPHRLAPIAHHLALAGSAYGSDRALTAEVHAALREDADVTTLRELLFARSDDELSRFSSESLLQLTIALAPPMYQVAWRRWIAHWEQRWRGRADRRRARHRLRQWALRTVLRDGAAPPSPAAPCPVMHEDEGPWKEAPLERAGARKVELPDQKEDCLTSSTTTASFHERARTHANLALESLLCWGLVGSPLELLTWRVGAEGASREGTRWSGWADVVAESESTLPSSMRRAWARRVRRSPHFEHVVRLLDDPSMAQLAAWSGEAHEPASEAQSTSKDGAPPASPPQSSQASEVQPGQVPESALIRLEFWRERWPVATGARTPKPALRADGAITSRPEPSFRTEHRTTSAHRVANAPAASDSTRNSHAYASRPSPISNAQRGASKQRVDPQPAGNQEAELSPSRTRTAGIVLLHPWLTTFYSRLELYKEGDFISLAARLRAAALLHWLATDRDTYREVDLTLEKVLCGVPLAVPLPEALALEQEERALGEGLLRAVIKQWNKLGNMSIDGFRGSFLCRAGLLHKRDDHWHLQVEKKTWDVLMSELPWSVSVVKMAWHPTVIHVGWV